MAHATKKGASNGNEQSAADTADLADSTVLREVKEVVDEALKVLRTLWLGSGASIGVMISPLVRDAWARTPYTQYIFTRQAISPRIQDEEDTAHSGKRGTLQKAGLLLDESKMKGLDEWEGVGTLLLFLAIFIVGSSHLSN